MFPEAKENFSNGKSWSSENSRLLYTDYIFVLDRGIIVEQSTHHKLMVIDGFTSI